MTPDYSAFWRHFDQPRLAESFEELRAKVRDLELTVEHQRQVMELLAERLDDCEAGRA